MSFETLTRNGTRGRRQLGTGGPIGRWIQKRAINRIRRKGKMPGLAFNALILTTIGRKSGVTRQTPLGRAAPVRLRPLSLGWGSTTLGALGGRGGPTPPVVPHRRRRTPRRAAPPPARRARTALRTGPPGIGRRRRSAGLWRPPRRGRA